MNKTINDVKDFWENNPLFSGESKFEVGSKEFFDEHKKIYIDDVFAKEFSENLFIPHLSEEARVLDLGCGVGFWTIEMLNRGGYKNMYSADLTNMAIETTKKRLELYELKSNLSIQNAESMTYDDCFFEHINCQGVIHHTPNTEKTVEEMARVLKSNGTAYISVYYKNIFLRNWHFIKPVGKFLSKVGAELKGRGREDIFAQNDVDEITRLYDGDKNPIGKSYSKQEAIKLVEKYFYVDKVFLNFFPARSLPFKIPLFLHRFLSKNMGFMIHLSLRKK
ncbi:class I SAM-dependent methyltransferase [Aliarcobacter cryaerophilus]|uniref:class I SAM-dependent methyltransferase n=1 Tax=Aliarcobacter cryaerophilus TaxID=28198 RepID=UPI001654072B|nr:class I SAM-dependent methyltransferase [Aliarcobacter cryaerophilus]QNM91541.1 class I SAM-dependent methyltransferase [Aliarcobacter cryaerophilus]